MSEVFRGVGVAIVTLFDEAGDLDAPATAEHAARLVQLGVRAVVVAGTTGEPMALERAERVDLIGAVRESIGDTPLIAGTGAPSTREAVTLTRDAIGAGADAVLALSPPGPVEIRRYYGEVAAAAGDTPVLAYHFPAFSAPGFAAGDLSGFGVQGVKDSSGDLGRLLEIIQTFDGDAYPGSPFLAHAAGSYGATGAILAIANVAPELAIRAFDGDTDAQLELASLQHGMTGNRWAALKSATATRFGTSTVCRMT